MTGTTEQEASGDGSIGLPRPRRDSRWRWSRPRQAMAAGGALAAILGLGLSTGANAGAATAAPRNTGTAQGPPGQMARPTVSGRISALRGDDVTVETTAKTSLTVVFGSTTTFKTIAGPSGGTTSSASALKVGEFIGVRGTKNNDGTVTATTVTIGRPPRMGKGGPDGSGKSGTPPAGSSGAPTA